MIRFVEVPEFLRKHCEKFGIRVGRVDTDEPEYAFVRQLRETAYKIPFDEKERGLDAYSQLWLAMVGDRPVGTMRVTYARDGRVDCEEVLPSALLTKFRHTIGSAGRFAVPSDVPAEWRIARVLIDTTWSYAVAEGMRLDIITAKPRAIRYYERLGYHLVPDSEFEYALWGVPSHVMILPVDPGNKACSLHAVFKDAKDGLSYETLAAWLPALNEPVKALESLVASYGTAATTQMSPIGLNRLRAGARLSYPAGTRHVEPFGFHAVRPSGDLIARLERRFPGTLLPGETPFVINACPTPPPDVPSAICIDTYCRIDHVFRALLLGAEAELPTFLFAQPLLAAEALLRHVRSGYVLPPRLTLCLSGYPCPVSLERVLLDLARSLRRDLRLIQLYGVDDIGPALLAATDRTIEGEPIYYPIDDHCEPALDDRRFVFRMTEGGKTQFRKTRDKAVACDGAWLLSNESRFHPVKQWELETWTDADWLRRTGYLAGRGEHLKKQLREGEKPADDSEIEYYDFAREHGADWLHEPDWA